MTLDQTFEVVPDPGRSLVQPEFGPFLTQKPKAQDGYKIAFHTLFTFPIFDLGFQNN